MLAISSQRRLGAGFAASRPYVIDIRYVDGLPGARRMRQRMVGRTGRMVSEVGFGSWGIGGGQWTAIPDRDALDALTAALDLGVTFIDTADVYGDGRSEKLIAQALRGR